MLGWVLCPADEAKEKGVLTSSSRQDLKLPDLAITRALFARASCRWRVERRRAAAALLWCCAVVAPAAIAALAARACAARLADLVLLWLTALSARSARSRPRAGSATTSRPSRGASEALGALLQLPLVRRRLSGADGLDGGAAAALSAVGGWCFLAALGAIASTHKRRSPVCWSQAILAELYLVLAFSRDPAPRWPEPRGRSAVSCPSPPAPAAASCSGGSRGCDARAHEQERTFASSAAPTPFYWLRADVPR